jgi:hypothetical protein
MKTSEMVFNYLKSQGLMPEFDDRNNIIFKYQMRTFLYFNNDEDEQFFNLTMPRIYDVTDDNRMAVFEAINQVNETTKVVKLTIAGDSVWCATEIMLDSTPEMDDLMPRMLGILMNSQQKFYNEIG